MMKIHIQHKERTSKYTGKSASNFLFLLAYTGNTGKETLLIKKRSSIYSIYAICEIKNNKKGIISNNDFKVPVFVCFLCIIIISNTYVFFACVLPVQRIFDDFSDLIISESEKHAKKYENRESPPAQHINNSKGGVSTYGHAISAGTLSVR